MSGIYKEENNIYQIDLSLTEWSTDEIHDVFHCAKIELSDVDFVGETASDIILNCRKTTIRITSTTAS